MKTAKEFWREKFDEEPQNDAQKLAVTMMREYADEMLTEKEARFKIELKQAKIEENLYWINWLREVEIAFPQREDYDNRIDELETESNFTA